MAKHITGTDIGPPCKCESTIYSYTVTRTVEAKCIGCHKVSKFTFDHWPDLAGSISGANMRKAHWRSV